MDDEKLALEYLEHIIDWEYHGFELIGVTTNPEQALAIYKTHRPDLVISDVKMPGLNGLELGDAIREYGGNTHILFLSAYKNFDYVKQAIRLGIDDYILKSDLEEDGFLRKILKLKEEIIKEKAKKQYTITAILEELFRKNISEEVYLAQKNRNEDVIAVNKAMIQILRDRLRIEVDNVYDTVEQEIKVVREYLLIQKYRYTGIFKSVIDIEAGVEPYLIAKNILQPLVENAFFHGILCNTDEEGEVIDGCITIRIRMEEDEVEIIVKDNGAGMSQDKLDELSKPQRKLSSMERGEHIGIKNIKERLDYIYENKYRFQIWSKEGEGTIVTIRIPAIVSSETEK